MPEALRYKDYPILFVDDEEMALVTFKNLFKKEFTIHTAGSGEAALELIERHPELALIVSDQRMPDMTGIELLRRISVKRPNLIRMLITAYTEIELVIDAINRGKVYRYITKPYNEEELKQTLKQGIERYYLVKERDRLYAEKIETFKKMAQANRLTAIGILAAGMAHEINNPLVAINTFLQMIPKKYDEEVKDEEFWDKFYAVALGETHRIQMLISQLLHYSKTPEEEGLKLNGVNINDLLYETITFIDNEAKKKGLTIRQDFEPDLPLCYVDREKIRQVFLNILLNAIQATHEGYIRVKTSADFDKKDHAFFHVAVEDTGVGIAEENIQKLFNPFFTTKQNEGTGLGLMMCHHIIEEHRGSIDVHSELGKGTTMTIHLPVNLTEFNRRKSDRASPAPSVDQ
ncbi:MAG: ATP-binding protein [Candidatus Manganitrophus sp. SB1]|nr:ATP-binding protein [Candidatus Manganitrophus morganii]